MPQYFVTIQPSSTGVHEVHAEDCPDAPAESDRRPLGTFASPFLAIAEARREHHFVVGCEKCCVARSGALRSPRSST